MYLLPGLSSISPKALRHSFLRSGLAKGLYIVIETQFEKQKLIALK